MDSLMKGLMGQCPSRASIIFGLEPPRLLSSVEEVKISNVGAIGRPLGT